MAEQLKEMEINLYDYLEIMRKHKKTIILILAVSLIVSFGMLYSSIRLSPVMFKITMFIEPGIIGADKNGEKVYLDSAGEINKKIQDRVYRWNLGEKENASFSGINLNFEISNPEETDLVEIVSIQKKNSVAKGIDLLNNLFVEIARDNEEKIKKQQRKIKFQLEDISKAIEIKGNMMKLQGKRVEILKQREGKLNNDIEVVKSNIKELDPLRKALVEKASEVSVNFLSPDVILENVMCSRKLKDQLDEILSEKEKITLVDIKNIETEICALKRQKEEVSLLKADIRNITLYREPKAERLISNQKRWVYPISGVGIGLFIGLFIAFSMESWHKYKSGL